MMEKIRDFEKIAEEKIAEALKNGEILVEGEAFVAGQEHMYLEPQGAWANPGENDTMYDFGYYLDLENALERYFLF